MNLKELKLKLLFSLVGEQPHKGIKTLIENSLDSKKKISIANLFISDKIKTLSRFKQMAQLVIKLFITIPPQIK